MLINFKYKWYYIVSCSFSLKKQSAVELSHFLYRISFILSVSTHLLVEVWVIHIFFIRLKDYARYNHCKHFL
jgi:hypothetical protein